MDNHQYKKLNNLKREKEKLLEETVRFDDYLNENKSIIQAVKDVLSNYSEMNPLLLYKMFINKIFMESMDELTLKIMYVQCINIQGKIHIFKK